LKRRNFLILGLILSVALLTIKINMTDGINFVEDSTNDVLKYEDGIFIGKGNYTIYEGSNFTAVDIVSLTLIGIDISLNLLDNPVIDNNHLYEVTIIWNSIDNYENKTEISVGALDGGTINDTMIHTVVNATGDTITASQPSPIFNSTILKNKKLTWEIDVTLFANMATPEYANATAQYTTIEGVRDVLYLDTHLEGEVPTPPDDGTINWGDFNVILSIVGTLLVCGFAGYTLGSITVYYLTTNIRSKQKNTIFMAVFVVGLAVLVNFWFWLTPLQLIWNIGIFLATIVFGYIWATRGIMRLKFTSPLPENLPIDTDEELSSVIVLAKGEAEDYNPLALIRNYYKKEETGVEQKSKFLQPFEFFKEKQKYKNIIKSQSIGLSKNDIQLEMPGNPYKKISKKIVTILEESFLAFDMYQEIFVNDWPTINQGLLTAISRGSSKIAILNLFTSESFEYHLALEEMNKIDYSNIGITVTQTEFLGQNDKIQDAVAKQIAEVIPSSSDLLDVGVILVSEGQPEEWDELFPTTKQEDLYRTGIKKKLLKTKKLQKTNVVNAWIEDRSPTMQEAFESLVNNGCKTIIHVAASAPIDCVNSLYDIPVTLAELAEGTDVILIPVKAWNDKSEIVKLYLGMITNAKSLPLKEMGKDADITLQSTRIDPISEDSSEDDEEPEK